MPLGPHVTRSAIALTAVLSCAGAACSQDGATFQTSVEELARSSRHTYDPAFLAGIGQIYCHMKALVGDDEPLRPDTVLAVLHQKHPDTQPKSKTARDVQRRAMILAGTLLCPDPEAQSSSAPPAPVAP